jgi:hypothetical protein
MPVVYRMRGASFMSNASHPVQPTASQSGPSELQPAEPSSSAHELDVLNDDVMIETAPDRPCGTIRVKLVYDGRSTPIPADDPWAE